MRRNIIVIIQARMGSSRLPGKVLKTIKDKTILGYVIDSVSKSNYIDNIVIATTDNDDDYAIVEYCEENNLNVFRGSENDVLDRYYQCAKKNKAKNIVRITADCPLHDYKVIDKVIEEFINSDYDYVTNTFEYTYPDGMDVEIFTFEALENAWKNSKLLSEREHVTPYIRNNKFKVKNVYSDKENPIYRLTLDEPEDFVFIESIINGIGRDNFNLEDIIEFLENKPELLEINNSFGINEGYEKSLKEDKEIF